MLICQMGQIAATGEGCGRTEDLQALKAVPRRLRVILFIAVLIAKCKKKKKVP